MRKHHDPVASPSSTDGAGFVGLCSIQLSYGCVATGTNPPSRLTQDRKATPSRSAYYQARLALGQSPAEARAAQRRIRDLAKRCARGELALDAALSALGAS